KPCPRRGPGGKCPIADKKGDAWKAIEAARRPWADARRCPTSLTLGVLQSAKHRRVGRLDLVGDTTKRERSSSLRPTIFRYSSTIRKAFPCLHPSNNGTLT